MTRRMAKCFMAIFLLYFATRCAFAASGILFVGDDVNEKNVYLLNPDGGELKKITRKPPEVGLFVNLDPSVSPDGRRAAFTSFSAYPDENMKLWSQWNGKPLYPEEFFIYGYDYFPSRIWKRSLRSHNWNIFVVDFDTLKSRQYSAWKWDEVRPVFMKRGSDVLYEMKAEKSVFVVEGKPSGKFKQITVQDNEALFPNLSPDGRRLVFQSYIDGNWELFDLKLAELVKDKIKTRLTHTSNVTEVLPKWSPNGKKILFLANRGNHRFYDLFIMDRATMAVTRLTNGSRCFGDAAWSPDGKRVVYTGMKGANNYVLVVDVETKKVTPVVGGHQRYRFPAWSPDGAKIAFLSDRQGATLLYISKYPNTNGQSVKATNKVAFWNQPVWF